MRKLVTILFLLVFLLQTFSQVCILLSFYINRDYISSNICINRFDAIPVCKGSCVLERNLKDNEKNEQTGTTAKIKEWQPVICQEYNSSGIVSPESVAPSYPTLRFVPELQGHQYSILRPPISLS